MSLFRRIFFSSSKKGKKGKNAEHKHRSEKYMPEIDHPIDEGFMLNFKQKGGKFIYCENENELNNSFKNILQENQWDKQKVCCFEKGLTKRFSKFKLKYTTDTTDVSFFFASCEYLIAKDGSILVCSHQLKEKKLKELPDNFVILAATSQLVKNVGEGLKGIKDRHEKALPTNISTIKNFESEKEKDFLSYGSSSKNLYLLLLEDL